MGDIPSLSLNALVRWLWLANPHLLAMSVMEWRVLRRCCLAHSMRALMMNSVEVCQITWVKVREK